MSYKMRYLIFIFIAILTGITYAQYLWANSYSSSISEDDLFYIGYPTDDGNFVLGAVTYSLEGIPYPWILKIDSMGNVLWNKLFAIESYSEYVSLKILPSGNYVFGTIEAGEGPQTQVSSYYLIELDPNGNIVSANSYSIPEPNWFVYLNLTNDSGYIMNYSDYNNDDLILIKINSTGSVSWAYRYDYSLDESYYCLQSNDGGYIIVGGISDYESYENALIIKFDQNGTITWDKVIGSDDSYQLFIGALELSDNSILAVGLTTQTGYENYDIFCVKFDQNGNVVWQKKYSTDNLEVGYYPISTQDGGIAITGIWGDQNYNDYNVLILKIDTNGEIQWYKNYGTSTGYEESYGLSQLPNGELFLVTYTDGIDPEGYYDGLIFRLDSSGNIGESCDLISTGSLTASNTTYTVTTIPFTRTALEISQSSVEPTVVSITPVATNYCSEIYATPTPSPTYVVPISSGISLFILIIILSMILLVSFLKF